MNEQDQPINETEGQTACAVLLPAFVIGLLILIVILVAWYR